MSAGDTPVWSTHSLPVLPLLCRHAASSPLAPNPAVAYLCRSPQTHLCSLPTVSWLLEDILIHSYCGFETKFTLPIYIHKIYKTKKWHKLSYILFIRLIYNSTFFTPETITRLFYCTRNCHKIDRYCFIKLVHKSIFFTQ